MLVCLLYLFCNSLVAMCNLFVMFLACSLRANVELNIAKRDGSLGQQTVVEKI